MSEQHARLEAATPSLEAPFAVVDLKAFWANHADLIRRANGKPIRLASKSIRVRSLLEAVLKRGAGFRGILAFTLPEALWLATQGFEDIVVAYPSTDRSALRAWHRAVQEASRPNPTSHLASHPTVMVDSVEQLDFIVAALAPAAVTGLRIAIDIDAGYWPLGGRVKLGAQRSPIHTPEQARALAQEVVARGFALVGAMGYEAQIAGVGDAPLHRPLYGFAIRAMQARSALELRTRRAAVVAALRQVAPLEFVNGGGTGSLERTSADSSVTELAAGSGLFAPTLFDTYRGFTPTPSAFFALPVVRRPSAQVATVLGGGYIASGAVGTDRLPRPHFPEGLALTAQEGAGEVQTPLVGRGAHLLRIGDRVWFRHAKAGELCERFNHIHLVHEDGRLETVPTYRGEGMCFL